MDPARPIAYRLSRALEELRGSDPRRSAGALEEIARGPGPYDLRRDAAFHAARAFARLEDPVSAIDLLRLAIQLGFSDRARVDSERDFDPLRNDPAFRALRESLEIEF